MESQKEVTALIERYIKLFNERDFEAALDCYHIPFTWLFDDKAVSVGTGDEFLAMMKKTRQMLDDRGLSHSELVSTTVRILSDHVALAGVEVVRHNADGSSDRPIGGTYLVHRSRDGWRLVAHGSHDPVATVPASE